MSILTTTDTPAKLAVQALESTCDAQGYADRTAAMLQCRPLNPGKSGKPFRVNAWYSEKCVLLQNETDAFALTHGRREINRTEHLFILRRMLSGTLRGRVGDVGIEYTPGAIYVQDQELGYEAIQHPAVFQNAFIFKTAVGYDPSSDLRHHKIDPASVASRCLAATWDEVFEQLWRDGTHIDADLFERFLACVKIALGTPAEREDVRTHARKALFHVICHFIERNLGDLELSVSRLLREFGVSRASLFRMFEHFGGVRNYIQNRRATRALLDLSQQPYRRGIINATAQQWGFSSAANFNRTIRSRYGIKPGTLFDAPPAMIKYALANQFGDYVEKNRTRSGASF